MGRGRAAGLLCALLAPAALAAGGASARDEAAVVDLAGVLGQSHALRQACAGTGDLYWRSRMRELVRVNRPDAALSARMTEAFNRGFSAARTANPSCTGRAKSELARVAARGQLLASRLAAP